jgi:hypothetical protein
MADLLYTRGLSEWGTLTSPYHAFMLLQGTGYTPNVDHDFVSEINLPGGEISVAGYSRQFMNSPTVTVDDTNNRVVYSCASPVFGPLTAGQTITAMVLYKYVSFDFNHILMAYFDLPDQPTNGGILSVTLGANGLAYFDQGA